jgi:hypothetical protein
MVYNHVVHGEDLPQNKLDQYANYLNEVYKDLSIHEMRDSLMREMSSDKARFDTLVGKALDLGMAALEAVEDVPDIVIQGKETVFNKPDLANLDRLRDIVNAFEDKGRIVRILNRVLEVPGVSVLLGEELEHIGMDNFSMVASGYSCRNTPVGSLRNRAHEDGLREGHTAGWLYGTHIERVAGGHVGCRMKGTSWTNRTTGPWKTAASSREVRRKPGRSVSPVSMSSGPRWMTTRTDTCAPWPKWTT